MPDDTTDMEADQFEPLSAKLFAWVLMIVLGPLMFRTPFVDVSGEVRWKQLAIGITGTGLWVFGIIRVLGVV